MSTSEKSEHLKEVRNVDNLLNISKIRTSIV